MIAATQGSPCRALSAPGKNVSTKIAMFLYERILLIRNVVCELLEIHSQLLIKRVVDNQMACGFCALPCADTGESGEAQHLVSAREHVVHLSLSKGASFLDAFPPPGTVQVLQLAAA